MNEVGAVKFSAAIIFFFAAINIFIAAIIPVIVRAALFLTILNQF